MREINARIMRKIIQISVNRFLTIGQMRKTRGEDLSRSSRYRFATTWVPKTRGPMNHDFDGWTLKAILESCLSPSLCLEFLRDQIGLVRPRHGRCKPQPFLFFLSFFSSRVHRFRAALQAHKQLSAKIGPALAEYWLTHRIRYKNGPTMRATLTCEIRRII